MPHNRKKKRREYLRKKYRDPEWRARYRKYQKEYIKRKSKNKRWANKQRANQRKWERKNRALRYKTKKHKTYIKKWRKKNKIRLRLLTVLKHKEKRDWLQSIKRAIGCMKCKESDPDVLEFHHRDPKTKKFNIGQTIVHHPKNKILKEIKKCDVFCSNCHKKLHAKERKKKFYEQVSRLRKLKRLRRTKRN